MQVGSIASQAQCVDFVGWSKGGEPQGGAWVRTEAAGSDGSAQLVFDLGESLHISRVDFLLEASDVSVEVDVAPATVVPSPGEAALGVEGFVPGVAMASAEFEAGGERAISMHLRTSDVSRSDPSRQTPNSKP